MGFGGRGGIANPKVISNKFQTNVGLIWNFCYLFYFFSQLGVYYLRYSINNSKPPSLPGPGLLLLLIQFLALLPENRSKPIFYRLLFSCPLILKDSQKLFCKQPRSISKSRHKALLTFPFLKQMHFECRALLQFREAESS